MKRSFLLAAGWFCLGLAVIGTVLPVMPTVPFLILAFWAFSKSSPRLSRRILAHPRFGPILLDWLRYRAIPRGVKYFAVIAMAASWLTSYAIGMDDRILFFLAIIYLCVAIYMMSRPDPPHKRPPLK